MNTPADVHYGLAASKAAHRSATLAAACSRNPQRFATLTDPKILALPSTTWINKPATKPEEKNNTELAA